MATAAFTLFVPGVGYSNLTPYVTQETGGEITARIERPEGMGQFAAPDLSVKLVDTTTAYFRGIFSQIDPFTTSWGLFVSFGSYLVFTGYILPNTVTFNEVENTIEFTAVGVNARLGVTWPSSYFARPYAGTWVVSTASNDQTQIIIQTSPTTTAPNYAFYPGDKIIITSGANEQNAVVKSIAPYDTNPTTQWVLYLDAKLSSPAPYNAVVTVDPDSNWKHNIRIVDAISYCYQASSLTPPSGDRYSISSAENVQSDPPDFFATPLKDTGRIGIPLGISPESSPVTAQNQRNIQCGTTQNTWSMAPPPDADWVLGSGGANIPLQPQDWTMFRETCPYFLFGPTFKIRQDSLWDQVFEIYTYNYARPTFNVAGHERFVLEYKGSFSDITGLTTFALAVYKETTTNGYTWTGRTTLFAVNGGGVLITSSPMNQIAYDEPTRNNTVRFNPRTGKVMFDATGGKGTWGLGIICSIENTYQRIFFTEPYLTGASGSQIDCRITEIDFTGAGATTRVDHQRGWLSFVREPAANETWLYISALDSFEDQIPAVKSASWSSGFFPLLSSSGSIPYDLKPWTFKCNANSSVAGSAYAYALAASSELGLRLVRFFIRTGQFVAMPTGYNIFTLPGAAGTGSPLYDWVDLIVVRDPTRTADGLHPWPMVGMWNQTLWWIDYDASNVIQVGDVSGLSAGDVLAHLSVILNATFWQDGVGNQYFKTRGITPTDWVGGSQALASAQDMNLISLRSGPIWSKTYNRVVISSDKDDSITAAWPIDSDALAGTVYELALSIRFLSSYSQAKAIARTIHNYVSQKLAPVEIEHEEDGRQWEVGKTFTATVNGQLGTYQIVEMKTGMWTNVRAMTGVKV